MVHTSAIATGVAIIGMMKTPRRKPRSGKFGVEHHGREGAEDQRQQHRQGRVKQRVPDRFDEARIVRHAAGNWRSPTKVVGEPTFHSCRLIQIVNTHGNTITASTTTSAGTTNGQ